MRCPPVPQKSSQVKSSPSPHLLRGPQSVSVLSQFRPGPPALHKGRSSHYTTVSKDGAVRSRSPRSSQVVLSTLARSGYSISRVSSVSPSTQCDLWCYLALGGKKGNRRFLNQVGAWGEGGGARGVGGVPARPSPWRVRVLSTIGHNWSVIILRARRW